MMFNTTFNNISVILQSAASHWQTWHIMLYILAGFKLTILVVIGIDCIGTYKSNYHDHDHDGPCGFNALALVSQVLEKNR